MKKARKLFVVLTVLLVTGLLFTAAAAADAGYVFAGGDVFGVVQSTDGAAIAGADVGLICVDAEELVATTEADAYGAFAFNGVADGNYLVAVTAIGFEGATFSASAGDVLSLELAPAPAALGRGIMPMSGPSLLIVFVNNNNPPAGTTATFGGVAMRQAPDRAFELNVAANASGNVVASAPGFVPATFFVNMAGQPFHVQPITIWEEPNLVIHVTCDLRGTPIANANVTLIPQPPAPERTGADGRAFFDATRGVTYMVIVDAVGFQTSRTTVTIPATGTITRGVPLMPTNPPAGFVFVDAISNATNLPIPNASVSLLNAAGTIIRGPVQTNESGRAVIRPAIATGQYSVVISAPGYATLRTPFTKGAQGVLLPVRLQPTATDSFQVEVWQTPMMGPQNPWLEVGMPVTIFNQANGKLFLGYTDGWGRVSAPLWEDFHIILGYPCWIEGIEPSSYFCEVENVYRIIFRYRNFTMPCPCQW